MDRLRTTDHYKLMSKVRGKNTQPWIGVQRSAHAMGLGFRLHRSDLSGRLDVVFPELKAVLCVDDYFWYRHQSYSNSSVPKLNASFWTSRFDRDVERVANNRLKPEALCSQVGTARECETRNEETISKRLRDTRKNAEVIHAD